MEEAKTLGFADVIFAYKATEQIERKMVISSDETQKNHPYYLPFPILDTNLFSVLEKTIGVVACNKKALPTVQQMIHNKAIWVCSSELSQPCSLFVYAASEMSVPHIPNGQTQIVLLQEEKYIDQYISLPNTHIFLPPFIQNHYQQKIEKILQNSEENIHILIVEDSALMREKISNIVQDKNITISKAKDGLEAIELIPQCSPDLIITDYEMPNMNGWELCRQINTQNLAPDIPIIMLTARSTTKDIQKSRLLGISEYITKPFRDDQLKSTVQNLLSKYQAQKRAEKLSIYAPSDALESQSSAKLKKIAILFSDIKSFTTMCEGVPPQDIVLWLNRYLDAMSKAIVQNNGIIDKFIGDAIVARFDCRTSTESCYNAAKASQDMLRELELLNKNYHPKINIRIGINWGEVILGDIGSAQHRLDYTMIGDAVNSTQRLESAAETNSCLASQELVEIIRSSVELGEKRELTVKNRKSPLIAYSILEVHD